MSAIRAVQCGRCSGWCLLTLVDGFKVAADVARLDAEGAREALQAGRSLYRVLPGFKLKSKPPTIRGLALIAGPVVLRAALDAGTVVGEHGCKGAFGSVPIEGKAAARVNVCDARRRGGWVPPADCPRAAEGHTAKIVSCGTCEPPPFDAGKAFVDELGARVVSIEIGGKVVYQDESLA